MTPLRGLHRAVLHRFIGTGAPPTARWIRQAGVERGLDATALEQLDAADAVHLVSGVVAVAYPFEVMCPHTAFHASRSSARAWLASRDGLDAEILDQETAIECGRLNFGTLLTGPA